ncbi:hypothetical protein [Kitasatospora aureofaciens]|uniref:hypothetical protein n=1 Tax=Kitasatospora aureofaciens TaxID=1894 RepID=UPI00210CE418|nr:hypothetical protein [Kitasatospora aureofaciens]
MALAVLFSVFGFQGGNVPIGVLFAVVAVSPIAFLVYAVVTKKRGPRDGRPVTPEQRRRRTLVLRVVALAMVGVVGYGVYWVVFEPKASDKALSRISDLEDGCGGALARKYFTQTAEHTGPGPHPVAMFGIWESGASHAVYPPSGTPEQWSGNKLDPHRVQLIACLDEPDDGEFITDCKFTSDSLKLYRGVYNVTVYEARTGKKLGNERVAGSAKANCPSMVYLKKGIDKLHSEPEFADYQQVLRKYVE